MSGQVFGTVILWLIVLVVVIVVAVYLLRWLYRRSTKETAFVRTGFGGEKVVINGGAFVIPVLHEVTPVNMNVMRIEVRRGESTALITRDRMRVDLIAEFFLRVAPIARGGGARRADARPARHAAGRHPRSLRRQVRLGAARRRGRNDAGRDPREARPVHGARAGARRRGAAYNGLELESVALVDVDQTSLEFFDPSNAFDAEGLTALTETIETRRKMRNLIEQQTMIEIRNQNLESERRVLEIDRESEYARLEQEREVEVRRADAARRAGARAGAPRAGGRARRRSPPTRRPKRPASPRSARSPRPASSTRKRSSSARSPAAAPSR